MLDCAGKLSSLEELEEKLSESMKRMIRNDSEFQLQAQLHDLPKIEQMFLELLSSGEFDDEAVGYLDQLVIPGNSYGGGKLLKALLRAEKNDLVDEWLEELEEKQCPIVIRMLLEATPEADNLLKELLRDKMWREAAVEYEKWLAENDPVTASRLRALLGVPSKPEGFIAGWTSWIANAIKRRYSGDETRIKQEQVEESH